MPDPQQIASDPDFLALSPPDRVAVLSRVDPDFAALSPSDKIAVASRFGQTVAQRATASLASRGLTTADVKAGKGVTTPDQITFADPQGGGVGAFLGGMASAVNPVNAVRGSVNAVTAPVEAAIEGRPMTGDEAFNAATMGLVPNLHEVASEAMRRGAANESLAPMYGGVAGAVAALGAGAAVKPLAAKLGSVAAKQFASVFPDHPLSQQTAGEMMDQGITMRNPRQEIADFAQQKANAGNQAADQAIQNSPRPINADEVNAAIQQAKANLYNPQTGAPLRPDAALIAKKLDAFQANHIIGNSQAFADADGNLTFQMDPAVARQLRQAFDVKPYEKGLDSADAAAQKTVGDALREQLNQDPALADANKQINEALRVKNEVAPNAAKDTLGAITPKRIAGAVIGSAVPAIAGHFLPGAHTVGNLIGAGLGAERIAPMIIDAMRSPLWKTTSAVTKANIAKALAARDYAGAAKIAAGISAGRTQDQNQ